MEMGHAQDGTALVFPSKWTKLGFLQGFQWLSTSNLPVYLLFYKLDVVTGRYRLMLRVTSSQNIEN